MDKFKEAFEKALNGGDEFSAAANNCIGAHMAQFDEGCAGIQKIVYIISLENVIISWKGRVPGKDGYT